MYAPASAGGEEHNTTLHTFQDSHTTNSEQLIKQDNMNNTTNATEVLKRRKTNLRSASQGKTAAFLGASLLLLAAPGCKNNGKPEKSGNDQPDEKMNILFIAVDDLRPELGCYGNELIHSPNIDKLASEGVMFTRSYCNIPVCGASRASMLTGTRPRRNTFIHYHDTISVERGNVPTLGKHFKKHGYHSIHNGKIMHHPKDAKGSWDDEWWPKSNSSWRDYALPENIAKDTVKGQRGPAFERAEVPDNKYKDGKIAEKTINDLVKLKKSGKPFFLATGFFKPHLPFNAPKKYWDLYDPNEIKMPENTYKPKDAPDESMHDWGELRSYSGIPTEGSLTDEVARNLKHGYYACVSYTDAQVGKILNALDSLGMRENTVVVLWGDHGWNLREHGLWCKHCNFHTSLHTPLIVSAPGYAKNKSAETITEFVDVYPTLCELAEIPVADHAEGKSFVNVLKNPDAEIDGIAVSRWREGWTLIKDDYFYTEWFDNNDQVYARMLFNHSNDPDENVSIVLKEENKQLVTELSNVLHQNLGEKFND